MGTGTPNKNWSDETVARLRALWDDGHSATKIGRQLGVSKNAVVGKAHRLHLARRPSPVKCGGPGSPPAPQTQGPAVTAPAAIVPAKSDPAPPNGPSVAFRADPVPPRPAVANRDPAKETSRPCCWPIGNPGTAAFRFCDEPALAPMPYCFAHACRAYPRLRGGAPTLAEGDANQP